VCVCVCVLLVACCLLVCCLFVWCYVLVCVSVCVGRHGGFVACSDNNNLNL